MITETINQSKTNGNGVLPETPLSDSVVEGLKKQYELNIWQTLVLGGKEYWKLMRRGRRDKIGILEGALRRYSETGDYQNPVTSTLEHIMEGLKFAEAMKRADRAVNKFFYNFYKETDSGKECREAMENPRKADHGWPHIRRVEEWVEALMLRDTKIRHGDLPYKFFLPALYLAIRGHDLIQQMNGSKEFHPELAAIWLLANYKNMAKAFGVSAGEAWVYARAAALIVLPHSNPEKLVGPDADLETISPKGLFEKIGDRFDELMPEKMRQDNKEIFEKLRQDDRALNQNLDIYSDSRSVLLTFQRLLSIGDKLESKFPGKLARLRSFMVDVSRKRPIYSPHFDLSLKEEIALYKSEKESSCDLGRAVKELTQNLPVAGFSFAGRILDRNTLAAIQEGKKLYSALMRGDLDPIHQVFDVERIETVLVKVFSRVVKGGQKSLLLEEYKKTGNPIPLGEELSKYSVKEGFSNQSQDQLRSLNEEKDEVLKALVGKTGDYDEATIARAEAIFNSLEARHRVIIGLPVKSGHHLVKEFLPCKYDTVSDFEEMQRGQLVIQ